MATKRDKPNSDRVRPETVLQRCFPMQMGGLGALKLLDIMEFSTATEERFVRLLGAMLALISIFAGEEGMSMQQAIAETAYRLGVSTATVKRYLQKHAVSIGPFMIESRRVYLREWAWKKLAATGTLKKLRREDVEMGVNAAREIFRAMGTVVGVGDEMGESGNDMF